MDNDCRALKLTLEGRELSFSCEAEEMFIDLGIAAEKMGHADYKTASEQPVEWGDACAHLFVLQHFCRLELGVLNHRT